MKQKMTTTHQSAKLQNAAGPGQGLVGQDGAVPGLVLQDVEALELKARLARQADDGRVGLHVWQDGLEVLRVGEGRHTDDDDVRSGHGLAGVVGDQGGLGLELHGDTKGK